MKALVVYCHPDPDSFTAAVLQTVQERLASHGCDFRVSDLYASGFTPVMTGPELECYLDDTVNRAPVAGHIADIEWCETLIFVYPTWWYGLPAMLKGWLDRTMLPGSAFHMPENEKGAIRPGLQHVTRFGVFTTCGASRAWTFFVGAPGKRTLLRGLRPLCARNTRTAFAAHYRMDSSTRQSRARHLGRVARAMDRLIA